MKGYTTCLLCPELVIREVSARTGGICSECFRGGKGPDMRHLEVVGRGYRIRVPRRKRRVTSRHRDAKHHEVNLAKNRALKRLRAIFPDLYDCLLAEERAALGLDPWPLEMAIRHEWDPDCTLSMRFAEVYHALNEGAA